MKVKTVNYQKVFPLAQYVNERIGVELEADEFDNPMALLAKAKEMVEEFHKQSNPQLQYTPQQEVVIPEVQVEKPDPKANRIDSIIADINSCTEIKVLESYKFIAKSDPKIQEAYDKKMEELK